MTDKKPLEPTYNIRESLTAGSRVVNQAPPSTDKPATPLITQILNQQPKK